MSPRPEDILPFPDTGPQPSREFLALCIEKMANYMRLAELAQGDTTRRRALDLAEGYSKVYRALKS